MKNKLNETNRGFTLAYPNGDFYIGKPYDLYELMTDFLIDWDNDKTVMTEYEAEDVASIRENYEEVFYAALEGGNYWEAQDFEEAFGRFSDYGIANALSNTLDENKTLNEREGNSMDKLELIRKIEEAEGIEYHPEDFDTTVDVIWQYFVDTTMFTEDEIALVTNLNGYNEETMNDMLYARFGYRDLEQMLL